MNEVYISRDKILKEINIDFNDTKDLPTSFRELINARYEYAERLIMAADEENVRPIIYGKWILAKSPYAEYEEGVDGESYQRYICSLCHKEAPFDCDPDGYATSQILANYCHGCGATMRTV